MRPVPPPTLWPDRRPVLLYDEEAVVHALDRMAAALDERLADVAGAVTLLALLTGGVYTAVWLSTRLTHPHRLEFLRLGRYGAAEHGGRVEWREEFVPPPSGTTIVVVDDVFDEGVTLSVVRTRLETAGVVVHTAVLARKRRPRPRETSEPDVVGLEVPDEWIVGCGLDFRGLGRHYPALYALRPRTASGEDP